MNDLELQLNSWITNPNFAALTISESYVPVTGKDTVFFPPTFAPDEGSKEKPSYVINNGVCIVDTVGSQANRLEPVFKAPSFSDLVPQITVKIGEQRTVNMLDAGHRAADAVVRFSSLWPTLRDAFLAYREKGQSHLLAKIAPTSLVFGVWDSRDTQAKLPRLVSSSIHARGVEMLTRKAQYRSAIEEQEREPLGIDNESLGDKDFPAKVGLVDNPSGTAPGGVVAREGIRREAVLNLVALRALAAEDEASTLALRRYVLGLALIAFTAPCELYLRQGCLLCLDPESNPQASVVSRDGSRQPFSLTAAEALAFARQAAKEFGVGENRQGVFEPALVKEALDTKKNKANAGAKSKAGGKKG